jgi:hypothetical protein
MSPTAAEHLKDEVSRALHLLADLTEERPPAEPLGKLQPALVKHCKVRSAAGLLGGRAGAGEPLVDSLALGVCEACACAVRFQHRMF